jgi:competence protein ComEA
MKLTQKQIRGLWTLATLLLCAESIRQWQYYQQTKEEIGPPEWHITWQEENTASPLPESEGQLKTINPNEATLEDWVQMGLSEKQAAVVLRYNKSGQAFRQIEDLRKLHVLSDAFLERVGPFLEFHQTNTQEKPFQKNKSPTHTFDSLLAALNPEPRDSQYLYTNTDLSEAQKSALWHRIKRKALDSLLSKPIDLNRADSVLLAMVPGVGGYLAGRITNTRKSLGGFLQLDHVPHLLQIDSLRWREMKSYFFIQQAVQPNWIYVNADSEETLRNHPLLSYRQAREIVRFREQFRTFSKVQELKKLESVDADLYRKIAPYLKLDLFNTP